MTYLYFYIEPNIKLPPHNADSEPISSASAVSRASLGKTECTCQRVVSDVPQQRNQIPRPRLTAVDHRCAAYQHTKTICR